MKNITLIEPENTLDTADRVFSENAQVTGESQEYPPEDPVVNQVASVSDADIEQAKMYFSTQSPLKQHDLVFGVLSMFGGLEAFLGLYEGVARGGIGHKLNASSRAFFGEYWADAFLYFKRVAKQYGHTSVIEFLCDEFYSLQHLDADDIAEAIYTEGSSHGDKVLAVMANYIGERACRDYYNYNCELQVSKIDLRNS